MAINEAIKSSPTDFISNTPTKCGIGKNGNIKCTCNSNARWPFENIQKYPSDFSVQYDNKCDVKPCRLCPVKMAQPGLQTGNKWIRTSTTLQDSILKYIQTFTVETGYRCQTDGMECELVEKNKYFDLPEKSLLQSVQCTKCKHWKAAELLDLKGFHYHIQENTIFYLRPVLNINDIYNNKGIYNKIYKDDILKQEFRMLPINNFPLSTSSPTLLVPELPRFLWS
jgi:hypothetical protein